MKTKSNYLKEAIIMQLLLVWALFSFSFGATALLLGWIYGNIPYTLGVVGFIVSVLSFIGAFSIKKYVVKSIEDKWANWDPYKEEEL